MPYTEFHYTPTGTGVISGKEVLEQTEDAINDLGGQISGDVQTAIDTANNAMNTANTANTNAQNAVNVANAANTTATNAQNTANAAQTTATNAQNAATAAQNDVDALENVVTGIEGRLTTTEGNVTNLTTRMGTAENNITTLQNDVITAQGTATSAQNTATLAREQAYVTRYTATSVSDNSTVAYSDLNNTDNIKIGDFILDVNGKLYAITAVDTANETVSVTTPLTQLAVDANVMHLSGDETAGGNKAFSNNITAPGLRSISSTEISGQGSNVLSLFSTLLFLNGDPSITARLNFRILGSDGSKSLYPHETDQYVLGLTSRRYANTWTNAVNGINPSALSLPDLSNSVDISSYITHLDKVVNNYTPPANGWLSIRVKKTSLVHTSLMMYQTGGLLSSCETDEFSISGTNLPVIANQNVEIYIYADVLASAKFYPCQGNV